MLPWVLEAVLDGAEVHAARLEVREQLGEVREAAADAVELVAGERVARLEGGERLGELRPIVPDAAGLLDEDVRGRHAEPARGVELQVELLVLGADPRVEDDPGHVAALPCWH